MRENFFVNNNILLLLWYWQFNIIFNHKTVRSTHIKRGNVHWKKIDFQTFVCKLFEKLNTILLIYFLHSSTSFFWHVNIYIYLYESRIPHIQQISSWVVWVEGYISILQNSCWWMSNLAAIQTSHPNCFSSHYRVKFSKILCNESR